MERHVVPDRVLGARLVVVTGKGGTGKSTVAAALALAAAARGRRTILGEVAGQARGPSLVARGPVATMTIDPQAALEEWLGRQVPRRIVGLLHRSGTFGAFVAAAPGARELLALARAWELGEARRWDPAARPYETVVLDAPASGHGVGMLRTPRTFADIARIGPIAGQARAIDELLRDPARCAIVAVALPGELAVSETVELERRVTTRLGRGLSAIVVNGVWPRRLTTGDLAKVDAANGALDHGARRAVAAAAGRVRTQQGQLARLCREAAAPVATLPFVFNAGLGGEDVAALAERLAPAS